MKFRIGDWVRKLPDGWITQVKSVCDTRLVTDRGDIYPLESVVLLSRPVLKGDVLVHPDGRKWVATEDLSPVEATKAGDCGWTHEDGTPIYAVNTGKMLPSIKLPDNWVQNASVGTIRESKVDAVEKQVEDLHKVQIDGLKARLAAQRVVSAKLRDELVPLKDENTRLKGRIQELESELYRATRRK